MPWVKIGAVNGFLAVAAGAFAAHALTGRLDERALNAFETGARYQLFHALALLIVGLGASRGARIRAGAGWSFLTGIVLFSGSLYAYALSGVRLFAWITPIGGMAFLLGWLLLAIFGMGRRDEGRASSGGPSQERPVERG